MSLYKDVRNGTSALGYNENGHGLSETFWGWGGKAQFCSLENFEIDEHQKTSTHFVVPRSVGDLQYFLQFILVGEPLYLFRQLVCVFRTFKRQVLEGENIRF